MAVFPLQRLNVDGFDPTDSGARVFTGTLAGEPYGAGLIGGPDLIGSAGHGAAREPAHLDCIKASSASLSGTQMV
jgi:hypothetical protein